MSTVYEHPLNWRFRLNVCMSVLCSLRPIFRLMLLVSAESALLGLQPLESIPNTTLLCLSIVNKSSFWQLSKAKSKTSQLVNQQLVYECVTAGACHLCLSHQGTRQLLAQVRGIRVSQQGLLACLGHSVLSTRLVQTLT